MHTYNELEVDSIHGAATAEHNCALHPYWPSMCCTQPIGSHSSYMVVFNLSVDGLPILLGYAGHFKGAI